MVRAELNDQLKVPLEFERTVKPHKFNHARMVCKPKRRMDYLERTSKHRVSRVRRLSRRPVV